MPIKKNNNPFAGKTKSAAGKKKTTGKRVGKSKQEKATPFYDGRLRLFSIPGNAFSPAQRIKRLIIHLTGIVVVYEK